MINQKPETSFVFVGYRKILRQLFLIFTTLLLSCTTSAQNDTNSITKNTAAVQTNKTEKNTNQPATRSQKKLIALLGDSMTWIGGDNCEKKTGWSYYLNNYNPDWAVKTYARSGATWTNTVATKGDVNAYSGIIDNENVIYNQVRRLINAANNDVANTPDIIVVFAGGNDAMFQRKRPGLFNTIKVPEGSLEKCKPSQFTTLASSIELGCRLLKEHFPNARIILVTPTEMSKATPAAVKQVGDVIETTGNNLGLEVLRADKNVNIRHNVEKVKPHKYTYDGIHSNPAGAQLIADFIIKSIEH